jgi:hypothetical protein
VLTDAQHVVSGDQAAVLAELQQRFPSETARSLPGDLEALLALIGHSHVVVRVSGRVRSELPAVNPVQVGPQPPSEQEDERLAS